MEIPISKGCPDIRIESQMETYKTVLQDIRDQLNAEAEAVQIILTGIDNDIYSTINACSNACEIWKEIERLKQGESINVQDLETNLYWEFRKFTSQDEAGSKDHPPMLAPGNYVQWKSIIKRYIDIKPNHEFIHHCLKNPPYKFTWADKEVPISEGSPVTRTESYKETYKNVSQDKRDQLNAERQELKTVSYHKLYDILKQHQDEVNEIRAERIARTANQLVLVAQQQPVYHPQNHPTQYTQNSSTRSQHAATRNRGKAIKIYKPTNNNLRTSLNTSRANHDNSLRINRSTGYENQRIGNVVGDRETVEDQELEAHYMYMTQLQEVSPDAADSGPIFDAEPAQKVATDDHYNVFAIESEHPEQSESIHDTYPIEQDEHT
nr:hypothetical protein [Tanacetum cinerariifolium]